jgi:hypothetical protein
MSVDIAMISGFKLNSSDARTCSGNVVEFSPPPMKRAIGTSSNDAAQLLDAIYVLSLACVERRGRSFDFRDQLVELARLDGHVKCP